MLTLPSLGVKTQRTLVRGGWALALAALIGSLALATLAQADGPTDPWQPSATYLAARTRILNFKARQIEQCGGPIGCSWSRTAPNPRERYRAWKYREATQIDGSRRAPSVPPR